MSEEKMEKNKLSTKRYWLMLAIAIVAVIGGFIVFEVSING